MDNQKVVVTAEKIKSFAIAIIGVIFFSWGTDYLSGEHLLYNVPRILVPVFKLFGPVGLAIGLMILGAALIAYGFVRWKKTGAKQPVYLVVVIPMLIAGIVLANVNFKSSKNYMEEQDQKREAQIEEVRNMKKPDFKNKDLEKHLATFDDLYKRYEEALQTNDTEAVIECEDAYTEWAVKTGSFISELDNDGKYKLSSYNAKLGILWNDLRQNYAEKD
jgi:hypothetical protein